MTETTMITITQYHHNIRFKKEEEEEVFTGHKIDVKLSTDHFLTIRSKLVPCLSPTGIEF